MARYRIEKLRLSVDTTALCDVGFLLVCFFLLVGRPRLDFESRVHVPQISPYSYPVCSMGDGNYAVVIVGGGKCYLGLDMEPNLRKAVLVKMGQKYGVIFTAEEQEKFVHLRSFGVPMQQLKNYIDNHHQSVYSDDKSTGIPFDDSDSNELYNWIRTARIISAQMDSKVLYTDIVGDEKENYRTIKTVISTLQRQHINKFNLINNVKPYNAAL